MGVGAVKRLSAINFSVGKGYGIYLDLYIPGCGIISFIVAKIFITVF